MKKKASLITLVVAGFSIGGGVILNKYGFDWLEQLLPTGYTIEVTSPENPNKNDYYAGEKLTLNIPNVESTSVYWVFDESAEAKRLGVSTEHIFAFDAAQTGPRSTRRVDAFFRTEDRYETASAFVEILNNQTVAISFDNEMIEIAANTELEQDWLLQSVNFESFSNDEYVIWDVLPESISRLPDVEITRWPLSVFGSTPSAKPTSQLTVAAYRELLLSDSDDIYITANYKPTNSDSSLSLSLSSPIGSFSMPVISN